MRKFGVLVPHILNPGNLCFTLRCSTPGQTATGTQVGSSGSLELLQKRTMFTEENNVSPRNSVSYGFKFIFMFVVYVQKMTFPRSCENEIKAFYNMMFLYRD
jgi:hypothetical protein